MKSYLFFFIALILFFTSCSYLTIETKAKNELIDSFTKDIYNLHNIKILPIRVQFEFSENFSKLSFYSYQKVDIGEVRQFLVESIEKFRAYMDSQPESIYYLSKLEIKNIEFTIIFINKEGNYVDDGYISMIFLCNGIIYYDIYNSNTDLLTTVHSESYNEALEIVQHQKNLNDPDDNVRNGS